MNWRASLKNLSLVDKILYSMTIAMLLFMVGNTVSQTFFSAEIGSSGTVSRIEVEGLLVNIDSVQWGTLDPGAVVNQAIQVQCIAGDGYLTLEVFDFVPPELEPYFTLTWDYSGEPIPHDVWYDITLTLTVSADLNVNADTPFSFTIHITAT